MKYELEDVVTAIYVDEDGDVYGDELEDVADFIHTKAITVLCPGFTQHLTITCSES
jgi:hypothetical protein